MWSEPLSDAFHFLFLGARTSRTKIPNKSKLEMVNFIPASPTLSLQKTERRGWGTPVWVGHSLRLRSGQALSDAFHFLSLGARTSRTKIPNKIKVRDGQLHSCISHPVSPKDGETRVGHPVWSDTPFRNMPNLRVLDKIPSSRP